MRNVLVSKWRRCNQRRIQTLRRWLRAELLERRDLFASDLQSPAMGTIPLEPPNLVAADRDYYASFTNGRSGNGSSGASHLIALTDTFRLHSHPTATKSVYLDFDGFTAKGTPWNSNLNIDPIISPTWDPDGNGPAFTDKELDRIQGAWQRVSADFAAFDVDVTTEDPGEAALVNTGGTDDRWGIRVVITLDTTPAPGSGGVAFINSFSWGYNTPGASDTPCYVFNSTAMTVAAAVSHEVGHSLGLSHDGTTDQHPTQPNAEYYNGHGTGENGWGPIMGSGYYENVTTWDNGVYFASSNGGAGANYGDGPDDLRVITSKNGFGYVPDPEADVINSAQSINATIDLTAGVQKVSQFGSINKTGDVDVFQFQTGSGTINLTFDPYVTETWVSTPGGTLTRSLESSLLNTVDWTNNQGADLDIMATLYDAVGNVVATSNPDGLRARFDKLTLTAGVYYVALDGVGYGAPTVNPPTGYTDYASIGQYLISGTVPVVFDISVPSTPVVYTEDAPAVQVTDTVTVFDGNGGNIANGQLTAGISPAPGATDQLHFDPILAGLTINAGVVSDAGVAIANFTQTSSNLLTWKLTSNATTTSVEKLIRSVTFEALGDAPDTTARDVLYQLSNGSLTAKGKVPINVILINDAPSGSDVKLPTILEDASNPAGSSVASLIGKTFADPDAGAKFTGIVIVGNTTPLTEGKWQFAATSAAPWEDVGSVGVFNGLVIAPTGKLRFLPGKDFNGNPVPLAYRNIDETYKGSFSTPGSQAFINISSNNPIGAIGITDKFIGINITAVNDPPVAVVSGRSTSVLQDQLLEFLVSTTFFNDVDDATLTYSVKPQLGTKLPAWLSFSPSTGLLSGTPGNLDVGVHIVNMEATDAAGTFVDLPLTITVINVNDAPTQLSLDGNSISENARGIRVGTFISTDPDPNDRVTYTVDDPRFEVRGNQLYTTIDAVIDYEQERTITVQATVTDDGSPPLALTVPFTIKVIGVNEFAPVFQPTNFEITEGVPSGTSVGVLNATDQDFGSVVRYRLIKPSDKFEVNKDTGEIRLRAGATLDRELVPAYQLFVEAYDDGQPANATTVSVNINVLDVNEFAPSFNITDINVSESQLPLATFAKIDATDGDTGQKLFYTILTSTGPLFELNPNTGELSLVTGTKLDFETTKDYEILVSLTDSGGPSKSTAATVTIHVTDANDPPTDITLSSSVVRSLALGVDVGAVQVVDQDAVQQYDFVPQDSRFTVANGRLKLKDEFMLSDVDSVNFAISILAIDRLDNNKSYRLQVPLSRNQSTAPWQNFKDRFDVDRDGTSGPLDVLALVNAINASSIALPIPRPANSYTEFDVDINGDDALSPLDVLDLVNHINSGSGGGGEGEASPMPTSNAKPAVDHDAIWLNAFAQVEGEMTQLRKRRS